MNDAARFALGIAVLLGAFIFMFFAFHPGGVEGVTNPVKMLQWLMDEFNNTGQTASASTPEKPTIVYPTPTGAPPPNLGGINLNSLGGQLNG